MRRKLVAQLILIILSSLCPLCVRAQDYIYDGKRVSGQFVEGMKLVNQAKAYLEDNKIEQAVAAAQRSVELAPESALTHLALGGAKARSGDLETGIEECKKAIAIDPTRPEMWMSLGNIYQADGKGSEALETLRQYLKRFPHDAHYNFIKSQVAIIEREQSTRPSGSSANSEDYFADATKRGIVKWVAARMPLSVYIEPKSTVRNFEPDYVEEAKRSFTSWAEASGNKVQFKFVDQPDSAEIKLNWTDNPKDVAQPAEGGEAKVQPGPNGIKSVSIKILTVLPIKELKVDDALIHFTCMHEVGHSLGMIGHSQNRGDVMYCSLPLNFESCALSARDAKTLQHLYSDDVVPDKVAADGISATHEECALDEKAKKEVANGNLQEGLRLYREAYAKYPNSQLIKHNLGCAINQVGLSDMNEQKYETAADKFKEALTVDANDKTAKINLGIALMNSGTMRSMQGNMVQAEPYYKQAVELLATSDNQTMLTTAVQHYSKYLTHVGRSSEAQQLEAKYLKH